MRPCGGGNYITLSAIASGASPTLGTGLRVESSCGGPWCAMETLSRKYERSLVDLESLVSLLDILRSRQDHGVVSFSIVISAVTNTNTNTNLLWMLPASAAAPKCEYY